MGRLRYGRYETLGLIASGGMASVHLGRARGPAGFERLVAIKVMHQHIAGDPEFSSMFLDEARLAAQIRHPNVVPTLDVSEDGRIIVMEYVEGAALSAILRHMAKEGERFPVPCALRIALDALDGLQAAHELRAKDGTSLHLVHRDISPHNVLVGVDGISRITDFGIAFAESRLTSTRGSQLKGKLPYMAPEQLEGVEVDRMVDVYAAGVVLWEMLVGRRLFTAENDAALACRVLAGPPHSPRELDGSIPAPIDRVVMKALARREGRYRSAVEFAEALEVAASESALAVARPRSVAFIAQQAQVVITPPPSSQLVSMDGARGGGSTTQPGHGDLEGLEAAPETAATRTGEPLGAERAASASSRPVSVATQTAAPKDGDSVPAARPVIMPAQSDGASREADEPPGTEHPPSAKTTTPVLGSARDPRGYRSTLASETGEERARLAAVVAGGRSPAFDGHLAAEPHGADEAPAAPGGSELGRSDPAGRYEHSATGASLVAPIPGLPRRQVPAWFVAGMLGTVLLGGAAAWWVLGPMGHDPADATADAGDAPTVASALGGGGGLVGGPTDRVPTSSAPHSAEDGGLRGPHGAETPNTRAAPTQRAPGGPSGRTASAPKPAGRGVTTRPTTTAPPTPIPPATAPPAATSPPPATTDTAFHPPRL